jgi:peptide/nickel transport system substrate-binding protein
VKRVFIPLVILLVMAFIVAGCGTGTTSNTPSSTGPAPTTPVATQTTSVTPHTSTSTVPATPSATPTQAGKQKYGGTLTWIAASGPAGPIGYVPEVTGPNGVTPIICFEALLKEMLDGTLKPGLAKSWDINSSADSPSVTFHLQQGVKFSDGTDFNAAAVKWNLDNIKKTPYFATASANWKSIEVVDNYTVRVNFTGWQNTLIRGFADTMSYMESPTAFEKNGIDWARYNMVGTGPFLQKNYQKDVTLSGTRNPNYWQAGKPYLDGVTYLFVADDLTAVALFKSGGGDIVGTSNPTELKDLVAEGDIVVSQYLGPTSLIPDAANADSPWSNPLVRQAAEYAIDKEAMANTFGYGFKAAYQFSTPASQAYDPNIQGRHYDVAKAKELMAQAGYPNGFKTTILASPIFLNRDAVVALQSYLSKIGIQADMQFPGFAQWSDLSTKPWHNGLIWTSINEWGNQNSTFNYFLGAPPVIYPSHYQPAGYAELLAKSTAAPQADPVMLKQLEDMIYDNSVTIPMYYGANNLAFKPYVMDTGYGTRGQSNWWEPQDTWLNK